MTDGRADRGSDNLHTSHDVHGSLCSNWSDICRGGPVPDRLSATLISRKFAVARACVRGPSRQADVSAAG